MHFPQPSSATRLGYFLILLAGFGWIFLSAPPHGKTESAAPAPQAGFSAPDFELETLNGQKVRLSDLRGQVVLINIWASWCPPCRAEMPAIQAAYADYKDQGFTVLAVNSTAQDTLSALQTFTSGYNFTFPILLDGEGTVTRAYQVQSLPSSFFVGRDGIIREVVIGGPMAEALLRSRIQNLLAEKP